MNRFFAAALAALLPIAPVLAAPLDISGIWRNEQDGFIVRIDQQGEKVRATLLTDHQYRHSELWQAGTTDFEGTLKGRVVTGREKIVYRNDVRQACPAIAGTPWAGLRLSYDYSGKRLSGSYEHARVALDRCVLTDRKQAPWSYVRVERDIEYLTPVDSPYRPSDTVAADCTPGKLIDPASPLSGRVWNALAQVKARQVTRTVNPGDPDEYLVFIVTDGTGNHGKQFINDPKTSAADEDVRYTPDQCRGQRLEIEQASGMLYTQYPTNSRVLYNTVLTHHRHNLIAVYQRGVGTAPNDWSVIRNFISSGTTGLTSLDFLRVADKAYAEAVAGINAAYQRNPRARFVFVTSGFSRGAAAARLINNRLRDLGVPDRQRPGKYIVAPGTARIGASVLYDTVVSLDNGWFSINPFKKSPAFAIPRGVQALHIVAENEYRDAFPLTLAGGANVHQVWVPGAHSDIGGTYTTDGISAVTLQMGLHYLHAAGVLVGEPDQDYDLLPSYLPNPRRFAIHDSRYVADQPFDRTLETQRRVIDTSYDRGGSN